MSSKLVPIKEVKSAALQDLFKHLPDEMKETASIEQEKIDKLEKILSMNGTAAGLMNRLPMICKNHECPYTAFCALYKAGLAPEGHPCPEEKLIIEKLAERLIHDFSIDPENVVELDMMAEYIDAELQEIRAQKMLALHGEVKETVTQIDAVSGTPYYEEKENVMLNVKERAQRKKEKIRKDFLATRELRKKYKLEQEEDEASRLARLKTKLDKMLESGEVSKEDIVSALVKKEK